MPYKELSDFSNKNGMLFQKISPFQGTNFPNLFIHHRGQVQQEQSFLAAPYLGLARGFFRFIFHLYRTIARLLHEVGVGIQGTLDHEAHGALNREIHTPQALPSQH
jgi:hypothetical protein